MAMINYRGHRRARPLEAALFWGAGRYQPALEGVMRAHTCKQILAEKDRHAEGGIRALLKASVARLTAEGPDEKWNYTKRHSIEVASFVYVMSREGLDQELPDAKGLDPRLAFAGGLIHDIGKTFLPMAIVVKELGVDFLFFPVLQGLRLTDPEKRVLREEHLATGTRYVRLFGGGDHIKMMLDMVGLHHVMYNGLDTGVPSYPSLLKGEDLPFHSRIAKTADFISAVLPRHYRQDEWISSLDGAVAYAVAVAGKELDPRAVRCFMTGFYDISPRRANEMIGRLAHPEGQEGISDLQGARKYAGEIVGRDPEFREMIDRRATEKLRQYWNEARQCAEEYGLEKLDQLPLGI